MITYQLFPALRRTILAGVANTLALVRLWLAQFTNVRGNFTNSLLVDTADHQLGVALNGKGDALLVGCTVMG